MNLTSFALLTLFCALGGMIAYFADRLGHRLGKKRLSLFGLRPRHTAEVITIGAGALIPFLTIVAILTVSSEVREWVREGPAIVEKVKLAQADVKRLDRERQEKTDQLSGVNARLVSLQTEMQNASTRLKNTNSQLSKLTDQYKNLTKNYELVAKQYKETKGNLVVAAKKYAALDATYTKLDRTYKDLERKQKDVLAKNTALLSENARVSADVDQGKRDIGEQKLAFDRLKRVQDSLVLDNQSAASDLAHTQIQLAQANVDLEVQKARAEMMLKQTLGGSRLNRLMFQMNDEVARLAIDPGLSKVQARAALDDLLAAARQTATKAGALPRENGLPAAFLFAGTDSSGRPVSSDEQESAIVDKITNLKENLVLLVYSPINAFKGESVALALRTALNPIVFKSGQTVAERRIDGRQSESQIVRQVTDFIKNDVSEHAKQKNMIPDPREPVIQVELPEIVELVKVIKFENRTIRLSAQADGDTRAASPLKLQFQYR